MKQFSVVIPTYNRPHDLTHCIESILVSAVIPVEVILIDDGVLPQDVIAGYVKRFEEREVRLRYYKKNHEREPRGLSESKNIALGLVASDIFFVLDDDVVVDPKFFSQCMEVWESDSSDKLIGVGGVIKNQRRKLFFEKFFNSFFGLSSIHVWDVNEVGYQVWDDTIKKRVVAYYTHGGACSYRTSLARQLGFAVFLGGRTALEDVDFALRAKLRGYYFYLEPQAQVVHNHTPVSRESEFLSGLKEGCNRRVIFKNNCLQTIKNKLWFAWATSGWILRQLLSGHVVKAFGMLHGTFVQIKNF